MSSRILDSIATGALVVAALSIAGVAVHRELTSSRPGYRPPVAPPTFVAGWERFSAVGTWIGDSNAKVRIVEFADFECPYCGRFHERFQTVRREFGNDVSLLLVQYPLPAHRFARPAAYAAECAAKQARWEQIQDLFFSKQDSFGLKTWTSYAVDAGVRDTLKFAKCVATTGRSARIDSSVAAGDSLKLRGTPTVLINGWRYGVAPFDSLSSVIKARLRAR